MASKNEKTMASHDAASGSRSSQRWSYEETRTLELCLMKYGIGQWRAILMTGLLPGKANGQLYNQTQRLLGQQSLAVFSGLCVDIRKVRQDNITRRDVTRKGGIIINTGATLSPEEKERRRQEALMKYGLTENQKGKADQELEQLCGKRFDRGIEPMVEQGTPNGKDLPQNPFLLGAEVGDMDRREKIDLLRDLRAELKRLHRLCLESSRPPKKATFNDVSRKNDGSGKRRLESEAPVAKCKKPRRSAKTKLEIVAEVEQDVEIDAGAVQTIVAMGYSNRHAVDALVENENNVEDAVQWLMLNCR